MAIATSSPNCGHFTFEGYDCVESPDRDSYRLFTIMFREQFCDLDGICCGALS